MSAASIFDAMAKLVSDKELAFLKYWEANRQRQKKTIYQLAVGLPMGLLLSGVILYTLETGWYARALMVANSKVNAAVLYAALIGIAVFVALFSKKFQWDQREQQYLEIKARLERHAAMGGNSESVTGQQ